MASRQRALRVLSESLPHRFDTAREVEAVCHSLATTADEYLDCVRRAASIFHLRPDLSFDAVLSTDDVLAEGTIVAEITAERERRARVFSQMLEEKYEQLNDRSFQAIVRCRRCGNSEISFDEKQTRSADEAATIFCHCSRCQNRWVIR